MPIYEYEPMDIAQGCPQCQRRIEVLQAIHEAPLKACPSCGAALKKIISWCRAAVVETSEEHLRVEQKLSNFEKEGMWSHAAELADKHSEKVQDQGLKMRALEDYRKAGYDADSLARHVTSDSH